MLLLLLSCEIPEVKAIQLFFMRHEYVANNGISICWLVSPLILCVQSQYLSFLSQKFLYLIQLLLPAITIGCVKRVARTKTMVRFWYSFSSLDWYSCLP